MPTTIRRAFGLLPAAVRWRWAALVPLMLAAAAGEALGAAGLFGLIKIVGDPSLATTLPVARTVTAWLPWRDPRSVVVSFAVLLAAFFLAKNAVQGMQAWAVGRRVAEGITTLSQRLLALYLAAPYPFILRRNSAEIIRNVSGAVDTVFRRVIAPTVALVVEACVVGAIVAVLLIASPLVTLVVVALLGGSSWVLVTRTRTVFQVGGARLFALEREVLKSLQQTLGAVKEIKVLGRERFFQEDFSRRQATMEHLRFVREAFATVPRLLVETVFVTSAFVLIGLVVWMGRTGPEILPLLGLYAYAGFRAIPSANRIMMYVNEIRTGARAVDRIRADLRALSSAPAGAEPAPLPFNDRIVLDRVSYAYDAGVPLLRDVSLVIRRGESVGVVGLTGAGKSTLVDVLIGLLPPTDGRVTVDGRDLATHARAWQKAIGYVPQSIVLVDDTIRRNVALGVSDAAIDEARLAAAVRAAQIEAFIGTLPAGLDTVVGERGVRLSGGERQRVGIARALYHAPRVLVFDEATSALDNRTEAEVLRAVTTLAERPTVIAVAHRTTSVRACDRLVFLAGGRLVAEGTFEALLRESPDFRRMVEADPQAQS
jgi:ABC-type multidrug transport system fused ATPase/permease subunit